MSEANESNVNRELLTLITDKIERAALRAGAHKPNAWRSHVENEYCIYSRIKALHYKKIFHEEGETFDHSIDIRWKEPIGKGSYTELPCGVLHDGMWYYPMHFGEHIYLWHPKNQSFQEEIIWTKVHWRPIYNYGEAEVVEALKLICETFNLEFSAKPDSRWFRQSCGYGGITMAL